MKIMNKKVFDRWDVFVLLALVSLVAGYGPAALGFDSSLPSAVWRPGSGPVSSATAPVSITSCRDITQPGSYVLGNNLSAGYNTCLNIHDTSDVQLDCQGFAINKDASLDTAQADPGLTVNYVSNFSIRNCQFNVIHPAANRLLYAFGIKHSSAGAIASTTISGGPLNIETSDNLTISNNNFNSDVEIYDSNYLTIENNTITLDPVKQYNAEIGQHGNGRGYVILDNQLNGGWDGVTRSLPSQRGGDSGIIMENLSDSLIQNNTIRNNWDAGIENAGAVSNVRILNNHIVTADNTGIGGWYYNSYKNNTVAGNIIEDAGSMLFFQRSTDLAQGEQTVYFKDNIFSNNKLVNPRRVAQYAGYLDLQSMPSSIPAGAVALGNNVFSGNDFNIQDFPPRFFPTAMIVDGGGNICSSLTRQADFPLHCGDDISIFTNESLQGKAGQYFAATFRASGGPGNLYTITSSGAPAGLRATQTYCPPGKICAQVMNQNSITLYGTPTQSGTFNFTVNASDSFENTKSQSFTIFIATSISALFAPATPPLNSSSTIGPGQAATSPWIIKPLPPPKLRK